MLSLSVHLLLLLSLANCCACRCMLHVACHGPLGGSLEIKVATADDGGYKVQKCKNFRYFLGQLSVAFARYLGQEVDAHNSRVAQHLMPSISSSSSSATWRWKESEAAAAASPCGIVAS